MKASVASLSDGYAKRKLSGINGNVGCEAHGPEVSPTLKYVQFG